MGTGAGGWRGFRGPVRSGPGSCHRKSRSWNRDGSIHGFTLLHASDRSKVPDWNLLLRPGTQEFTLTAPAEPGEYVVVCTVICSEDHEGMNMRLVVVP